MSREPRRENPRAKKDKSLARDRRNAYGENDKASRKAIPLRKAWANRVNRREEAEALALATGPISEELAEKAESRLKGRRPTRWKKTPDIPLGEWLQGQREAREYRDSQAYQDYKAERKAALARFSQRPPETPPAASTDEDPPLA